MIDISLIAAFVCAIYGAVFFYLKNTKLLKKVTELETAKEAVIQALKSFEHKHLINPSEDCSQLLADLVSSGALLRIEIIDGKDLFLRRR